MEFQLSIIICVKDSSSDLEFHLNEAENYNSRQIIFVCGTDKEYEYAKRFVKNNKKSYVVKRDNSIGIGDARKVGMESAESEYTMYLGPDNRITKDKIQEIITDLKNSRFSALAFSQEIKENCKILDSRISFHPTFQGMLLEHHISSLLEKQRRLDTLMRLGHVTILYFSMSLQRRLVRLHSLKFQFTRSLRTLLQE